MDDIDKQDNRGRTQLYQACRDGQLDAARSCLDCGIDVDRPARDGTTPLFIACYGGRLEAARLCLDRGVKKPAFESTPIRAAFRFGEIVRSREIVCA